MVRLKGNIELLITDIFINFNSKMVRLKVDLLTAADIERIKFQFQDGAVKRMAIADSTGFDYNISIPRWCG